MISIVICSRDPVRLRAVSDSVQQTIGVPHEIVAVDNSDGQYGICEAYNRGAAQSQYPLLCFMHEDLVFHSHGWGHAVAEALADTTTGLIGVVGGALKTESPSGYWVPGFRTNRINLYQRNADGSREHLHHNPQRADRATVVAVDGLWMCCRRDVWARSPFDEMTFPGFHLYDLDFAFGVRQQGLSVRVVFDVLIEHFSPGAFNRAWIEAQFAFHAKWKALLPAATVDLTDTEQRHAEFLNAQEFAYALFRNGYPRAVALPYVLRCLRLRPFDRRNAWLVRQALLGSSLDSRLKLMLQPVLRRVA